MYFDKELNVYTSESPAEKERKQNRSIKDLEKRIADLERKLATVEEILDDLPPRRSGSLR